MQADSAAVTEAVLDGEGASKLAALARVAVLRHEYEKQYHTAADVTEYLYIRSHVAMRWSGFIRRAAEGVTLCERERV